MNTKSKANSARHAKKKLIIVGNGMVGHRFCEILSQIGATERYDIRVYGEEKLPAYNRVKLSEYFEKLSAEPLMLTSAEWYAKNGIELITSARIKEIDHVQQFVVDEAGAEHAYDQLVLATGAEPFVPPLPGRDLPGVFVYRTIEDLEAIIDYAQGASKAAIIGGGLLGLEAAKASLDMGLETHVVEMASRLMPRQLDDQGAGFLRDKIEALGVNVYTNALTRAIIPDGDGERVSGLSYALMSEGQSPGEMKGVEGDVLDVDLVIISAGIRARDELARASGLTLGPRGGIVIDENCRTSSEGVYAIGDVASFQDMVYGLVAPGYDMAEVVARNLMGDEKIFAGADLSTQLKLIGIDVASFGDAFAEAEDCEVVRFVNPQGGIYKKLVVSADGQRLIGGMMVGDATDYSRLTQICDNEVVLPKDLSALFFSGGDGAQLQVEVPGSAQICKCYSVTKDDLLQAINQDGCTDAAAIKSKTRAGTGCGGCLPQIGELLHGELKKMGRSVVPHLCEHFALTRQELFAVVKIKELKTFGEVIQTAGSGLGCEVCKPAVASILASVWNECVAEPAHTVIQDTNDRFLANIQKGGTYSVVPRVPAGEITPEQLIRIGEVAKKFELYTKITGGQRIDLFGARVDQLPAIWEELIEVGLESGHAYGKALRTVKSCVGSTWCRFGVQDSTTMAIRIEERYRGLRSPHKLKSAVSGCIRECAEAQSKDFGIIATEQGWNLYVCGNGGAKPQHAVLLAADLDDATLIRYIDRFLMYYIRTADRLERTAWWFNKLEGGIEHLRDVIIDDRLGIAADLEADMEHHVATYQCEWKQVVENPELRMQYRHFANDDSPDENLQFKAQRGQRVPVAWDDARKGRESIPR
jgi:nitrite reductase (NADH) large subunit